MWDYVLPAIGIYLVIISLVTFLFYGIDKSKAKRDKWRIPEATLIILCFIGGGIGGLLGMKVFRHKTQHLKFKILVPLSVLLWAAGIIYIMISSLLP